jgi:lipid A disaccharide synthetase
VRNLLAAQCSVPEVLKLPECQQRQLRQKLTRAELERAKVKDHRAQLKTEWASDLAQGQIAKLVLLEKYDTGGA